MEGEAQPLEVRRPLIDVQWLLEAGGAAAAGREDKRPLEAQRPLKVWLSLEVPRPLKAERLEENLPEKEWPLEKERTFGSG